MGYQHPLVLTSARGVAFVGRRRPRQDRLDPLLRLLVELPDVIDPAAEAPEGTRWLAPGRVLLEPTLGVVAERFEAEPATLALGPSLGERAWRGAHQLAAYGVSGARPLAWLGAARRARRAPSFWLFEHHDAAPLPLEAPSSRAGRRLAARIGDLLRRLHASGLFHQSPGPDMFALVGGEPIVCAPERLTHAEPTLARRRAALAAFATAAPTPRRLVAAALAAYLRHDAASVRAAWLDARTSR
jgi:hypothetical protein